MLPTILLYLNAFSVGYQCPNYPTLDDIMESWNPNLAPAILAGFVAALLVESVRNCVLDLNLEEK